MAGRLPSLRSTEVDAFLERFAPASKRTGNLILGKSRDGRSFSLHLAHGGGMRPDILGHALKYIGVSRTEFEDWRASK